MTTNTQSNQSHLAAMIAISFQWRWIEQGAEGLSHSFSMAARAMPEVRVFAQSPDDAPLRAEWFKAIQPSFESKDGVALPDGPIVSYIRDRWGEYDTPEATHAQSLEREAASEAIRNFWNYGTFVTQASGFPPLSSHLGIVGMHQMIYGEFWDFVDREGDYDHLFGAVPNEDWRGIVEAARVVQRTIEQYRATPVNFVAESKAVDAYHEQQKNNPISGLAAMLAGLLGEDGPPDGVGAVNFSDLLRTDPQA